MHHRLFFALWPDDGVRARIDAAAAAIEREHRPGGRRLRRDRLHLTVQFLGDFAPLPDAVADAARDAASRIDVEAFVLTLDCAGGFRGSRVGWLGCRQCPPPLHALHDVLGRALAATGLPADTRAGFTPHVTVQRDVHAPFARMPVAPIEWPVREFVLIDSRAGEGYVRIGRWPLRG